jgi:4-carboxymuconolactone decarboxylase
MTDRPQTAAQRLVGDIAPELAVLTDEVLFGNVWERAGLAKRDRSLITCAALITNGSTEQLKGHLARALDNGVSPDEIIELITHLAFYAGWPRAMSAVPVAREVFSAVGAQQ